MKKNLLTITMLVLCLVISISLVAVPASAQVFYCIGTQEVSLIDEPYMEMTLNCEGDIGWGVVIYGFGINELGQVYYEYETCSYEVENGWCYGISAYTGTLSNKLLKKEDKYVTLDGDKLEVEFKFKPLP